MGIVVFLMNYVDDDDDDHVLIWKDGCSLESSEVENELTFLLCWYNTLWSSVLLFWLKIGNFCGFFFLTSKCTSILDMILRVWITILLHVFIIVPWKMMILNQSIINKSWKSLNIVIVLMWSWGLLGRTSLLGTMKWALRKATFWMIQWNHNML